MVVVVNGISGLGIQGVSCEAGIIKADGATCTPAGLQGQRTAARWSRGPKLHIQA